MELTPSQAGGMSSHHNNNNNIKDGEPADEKPVKKSLIVYAMEHSQWLRDREDYALFLFAPENSLESFILIWIELNRQQIKLKSGNIIFFKKYWR